MTRPLSILLAGLLALGCHKAPDVRWYGCAPTAAARVLNYWGVATTAQQLAVAMTVSALAWRAGGAGMGWAAKCETREKRT